MATWNKQKLPKEDGEEVQMQVPLIVSASRSTDVPAFFFETELDLARDVAGVVGPCVV